MASQMRRRARPTSAQSRARCWPLLSGKKRTSERGARPRQSPAARRAASQATRASHATTARAASPAECSSPPSAGSSRALAGKAATKAARCAAATRAKPATVPGGSCATTAPQALRSSVAGAAWRLTESASSSSGGGHMAARGPKTSAGKYWMVALAVKTATSLARLAVSAARHRAVPQRPSSRQSGTAPSGCWPAAVAAAAAPKAQQSTRRAMALEAERREGPESSPLAPGARPP
mmetsp:Transcript_78493/g.233887  ORF Transcript_78493/g.233887 Transcript_78493/m.233887 type:complete len:236 (+) Transcript_78493:480-1187(+)